MRPIDGENIRNDIALYLAENAYLNDTALDALKMVAKWLNEAPTLTADDYFDAVDRIKPCPNCRYTLLGVLTEDEPRWIPVTERLPEDVYGKEREQIVVLVCTKSGKVSQCARMADYECIADETLTKVEWIKNGKFYWSKNKAVTHWMPLPEAPKEKSHD